LSGVFQRGFFNKLKLKLTTRNVLFIRYKNFEGASMGTKKAIFLSCFFLMGFSFNGLAMKRNLDNSRLWPGDQKKDDSDFFQVKEIPQK
jgi:hypothetical protein